MKKMMTAHELGIWRIAFATSTMRQALAAHFPERTPVIGLLKRFVDLLENDAHVSFSGHVSAYDDYPECRWCRLVVKRVAYEYTFTHAPDCEMTCLLIETETAIRAEEENTTMNQRIDGNHEIDNNDNPAGGVTTGVGINIRWQNGPLGRGKPREEIRASDVPRGMDPDDVARKEPNGAFVEGVIEAAIGRLRFYQTATGGKFACRENAIALTHLETALLWLEKRTADREARQVEGTHTP